MVGLDETSEVLTEPVIDVVVNCIVELHLVVFHGDEIEAALEVVSVISSNGGMVKSVNGSKRYVLYAL
jgi:hypothetical protein